MRRPTLSAWRPRRGEWDREAAAHLWERAGFGPAPGALERALEQGLEATQAELLQPAGHATGAVEAARHLLPLQSIDALAGWWMSLILADGDPLRERVTLMWHDHFATSQAKVADVRLMHRQNELMRELGLGDFRALMHALSTDPAMLVWLDGDANKRGEPNENFARELMELFGLGIGNYSEQDVQEAARAFTGWGTRGRSFALREGDHDPGTKQLFGESGRFRGEDAIRLVLEQPACARHIARRLLKEFVHPTPESSEVDALAESLVDNDWDIERTLAGLLASELFFSERARRARMPRPSPLRARSPPSQRPQGAPAPYHP